ncbi:MAG TPA: extracellular solute-binding protein [bacterium]|nr:extracellular solute-binding protein [bacterium]
MRNDGGTTRPALRLLSWRGIWGRALLEAVIEPFARETGIRVEPRFHVGLTLPDPLDCDVVWSNAVPALRMAAADACLPLTERELPSLASLHPRAKPLASGRGWPIVCPYAVHYVLGYRREAFAGRKPDSWAVMLEPRFRGKLALYPGGNGLHPIAQVMGGGRLDDIPEAMEPCWNFVGALRPQVGGLDYSIGMEERIRRRELDLFFRALPNALAFQQAGLDVDWAAPKEGIADTLDALWIPKNIAEERLAAAKKFIDFALSAPVLQNWCAKLGALPLNLQAAPSGLFGQASGLPTGPDDFQGILHIPEQVKLHQERAWQNRFERIFSSA